MPTLTRTTDPKARVSLPKAFASTTVLIEQVSETELRIRKAQVVPEDEVRFVEETQRRLSVGETKRLLELLENPPPPNAYLKKAMRDYKKVRASVRKPRRG